jgi:hypothetical protein
MEANMLGATESAPSSGTTSLPLADRVRDALTELAGRGAEVAEVWARNSGPHVLLGLGEQEAFARLTPLGGNLFGLAFRAPGARANHNNAWEPLLLVDELVDVVEHAVVAIEAIPIQ